MGAVAEHAMRALHDTLARIAAPIGTVSNITHYTPYHGMADVERAGFYPVTRKWQMTRDKRFVVFCGYRRRVLTDECEK